MLLGSKQIFTFDNPNTALDTLFFYSFMMVIPGQVFIKMYSHKLNGFIFTTSTYSIYFLILDEKFK